MAILKIVANIATSDPQACAAFYQRLFGLDTVMDMGWITTLQAQGVAAPVQISAASQGGADTAVPDLSIEVDDLDQVIATLTDMDCPPEYGPVLEPWGVRRLFVRDPAGTLLNILTHAPTGRAD